MYKRFIPLLLTHCMYAMQQATYSKALLFYNSAIKVGASKNCLTQPIKQSNTCTINNSKLYKNLCFLDSLLKNDGAQLKDVVRVDSSGYCSGQVKTAEILLYRLANIIDWSKYSLETMRMAIAVSQRSFQRKKLLQALHRDQFDKARAIIRQNPYALCTYFKEYSNDLVSIIFARKFLCIATNTRKYYDLKDLLHYGFDLNLRNESGKTLLSIVVSDWDEQVKYRDLLKGGVSVNIRDKLGKTALSYAMELGDHNKINALLRYGAVIDTLQLPMNLFDILQETYLQQICIVCKARPLDRSNIPCVSRHLGHFICKECYMNNKQNSCPLCQRKLDAYGL